MAEKVTHIFQEIEEKQKRVQKQEEEIASLEREVEQWRQKIAEKDEKQKQFREKNESLEMTIFKMEAEMRIKEKTNHFLEQKLTQMEAKEREEESRREAKRVQLEADVDRMMTDAKAFFDRYSYKGSFFWEKAEAKKQREEDKKRLSAEITEREERLRRQRQEIQAFQQLVRVKEQNVALIRELERKAVDAEKQNEWLSHEVFGLKKVLNRNDSLDVNFDVDLDWDEVV